MAEISIGDITARLRVDASEWQRALQAAQQQLRQFAQAKDQVVGNLGRLQQALGQNQQGLTGLGQRTQQGSQTFQQFNQQINQTRQSLTQINQSFQQFTTNITNTTSSLNQAQQAAQRTGGAWSQMLQIAGGIGLATTIGAITSAIVKLGTETVQAGAKFELLRASLSAIAGSTAAGQQQFQALLQTAQGLGVAFEPLAQGWRRLTAAASQTSLSLQDQQRLLTAVATESRRVGTSNEELSRLMTGLAQVFSKGKLSMEELRQQIGEALPTAFAATARGMGRTTEELEKLISTGSVGAVSFAKAFTRGLEDIQRGSGQMADGFVQAMNRLTTSWKVFQDALANSGVNQYFTTVINNVRELVDWMAKLVPQKALPIQGPTPQGTTLSGGTAAQQTEAKSLEGIIARYTRPQLPGETPAQHAQYTAMAARAQEQLDQLRESITLTETQATAQAKVTAEVNKTNSAKELQGEFEDALRKKLADVRKAQEDFRKEAELAPALLGRPQGTPEEMQTYLKGQQQATKKFLDELVTLAAAPPQGGQLPAAQRQEIAALNNQYGQFGATIDAVREKEAERIRLAREGEQEAQQNAQKTLQNLRERERLQEQLNAQQERDDADLAQKTIQGLRDIETEQERLIESQRKLAAAYGMTKEARDSDTSSTLTAQLALSQYAKESEALNQIIQDSAKIEAQLTQLRREAADSARALESEQAALRTLEENLALARTPRGGGFPFGPSREELRLQQRLQGDITSEEGQRRAEHLRETLRAQERLNYAAEIFTGIAQGVGSAWTSALSGIADGTRTVGQAFQEMGRSILQTMAQIASQEAFKGLIRLGVGLIAGGATGGVGGLGLGGEPAGAVGAGINPLLFQHGGIVNRPTLAMLGENPAHNPEVVLNRQQLQGLFQSGPYAGGQAMSGGSGVVIMNYPSKAAAEESANQQRALGRDVVLNEVISDLSKGENSQINRMIRTLAR